MEGMEPYLKQQQNLQKKKITAINIHVYICVYICICLHTHKHTYTYTCLIKVLGMSNCECLPLNGTSTQPSSHKAPRISTKKECKSRRMGAVKCCLLVMAIPLVNHELEEALIAIQDLHNIEAVISCCQNSLTDRREDHEVPSFSEEILTVYGCWWIESHFWEFVVTGRFLTLPYLLHLSGANDTQ